MSPLRPSEINSCHFIEFFIERSVEISESVKSHDFYEGMIPSFCFPKAMWTGVPL